MDTVESLLFWLCWKEALREKGESGQRLLQVILELLRLLAISFMLSAL